MHGLMVCERSQYAAVLFAAYKTIGSQAAPSRGGHTALLPSLPPPSHTPPTLFEDLDMNTSSTGERYTADNESFGTTYLGRNCLDWVLGVKSIAWGDD